MGDWTPAGQDFLVSPDVLRNETCQFESAGQGPGQRPAWQRYQAGLSTLARAVLVPLGSIVVLLWALGRYEQRQLSGMHMRLHRVCAGEDLRELARRYYENPALWMVIFQANRDRLLGREGLVKSQLLVIPQRQRGDR